MNQKDNIKYFVKITKHGDNDFYFKYPSSGMNVSGVADSLDEAVDMARDAIAFTLYDMQQEGKSFPESNLTELFNSEDKNTVHIVVAIDVKEMLVKFDTKPVTKTLSIPRYQEHYLSSRGVSLSKFVQKCIEKEMEKV